MHVEIQRLLIVRLSSVGDVINVIPALTALRKQLPSAHISWLVEETPAGLLEEHPALDEVIVCPLKRWRRSPLASAHEFFRFIRTFSSRNFDVVLDFQGNLKSGILVGISRAARKIGFAAQNVREYNHLFTKEHVKVKSPEPNRVERYLGLLDALELDCSYHRSTIAIGQAHYGEIDNIIEIAGVNETPLVIMHPGTSEFGKFKRWPPAAFGRLACMLADEHKLRILVTGGPSEDSLVEHVVQASGGKAERCPGLSSLKALAALISKAALFISADTGPMHLAALLGCPVVALFGPKDPAVYGPYGTSCRIIRSKVACSPCTLRSCENPICMSEIKPEDVYRECRSLLKIDR